MYRKYYCWWFRKNSSNNGSTIVIKRCRIKTYVISRDYGGKNKYPHYVTKNDTFCKVGDEPIILSKKGAVIVSK